MPRRGYSNVATPIYLVGTLDGTSTSNVISVSTAPNGTATAPPGWPATYPYSAVIDAGTPDEEVIAVTAGTGGSLTITRGGSLGAAGYGTATKPHQSGAPIVHVATAADYDENNAHVNASSGVHGLAVGSSVVGTTDPQTLTGKTLDPATAITGAGSVVSTDGTQTLTGKTLAAATIIVGSGSVVSTDGSQTLNNKTLAAATAVTGAGSIVSTAGTQTLTNKTLDPATPVGTTGAVVSLNGTQTLTNKTLDPATAVGANGAVVSLNGTQTLSAKTLTSPAISGPTMSGAVALGAGAVTGGGIPAGRNLATSLPSAMETGAAPTMAAGWALGTEGSSGHRLFRVNLGSGLAWMIHVQIMVQYTGAGIASAANGNIADSTVCTLPAGYLPAMLHPVFFQAIAAAPVGTGRIGTDGTVVLQEYAAGVAIATNQLFRMATTFLVPA